MVSKLDSWSKGCGFESHPILDRNGPKKAMPGLIPAPNPGIKLKERKIQVA